MSSSLVRPQRNRMLAGVCAGLGDYFNIDPTIVRLLFALAVFSGLSPAIYIVLWAVIPQEAKYTPNYPAYTPPASLPQNYTPSVNPNAQTQAAPAARHPLANQNGPTGEWQYDPYTGERLPKQ